MVSFLTFSQNRIFQEKINKSANTDFMKSGTLLNKLKDFR